MKNLLLLSLLISINCYAGNYQLKDIENTCAPWDGHAIAMNFTDSSDSNSNIRVMLWKFPNSKYNLGNSDSQKYDGSINFCNMGLKMPTYVVQTLEL